MVNKLIHNESGDIISKDVNFEGKIALCGRPSTILTTLKEHLENYSQVQDIKTLNLEGLNSVSYNSESMETECIFRKKKLLQNFTKEKRKKKLARKMRRKGC